MEILNKGDTISIIDEKFSPNKQVDLIYNVYSSKDIHSLSLKIFERNAAKMYTRCLFCNRGLQKHLFPILHYDSANKSLPVKRLILSSVSVIQIAEFPAETCFASGERTRCQRLPVGLFGVMPIRTNIRFLEFTPYTFPSPVT